MASEGLIKKARNRTYPGFEKENSNIWQGPFYFIQGADTQFGMISTFDKNASKITWDAEIALAKKAIRLINTMTPKPRFFIVCGDLVDAFPGMKDREAQEKDFIQVFKELREDIPLVCVCGNHDIGDTPTPASIQNYQDKFGDDYFSFYCDGVMFIVLNSQYFQDSTLVKDLAEEQEKWLEEKLSEAKSEKFKHVIIFQHIPWFLKNHDEEKEYFNIFPELRLKMLKKFYDANIRAIFCGHYHRNAGGFYKDLEVIVTSAVGCQMGDDKSGFRIVKLGEEKIEHEYLAFEDAPHNIILK
ncbi:Serine/threonine-protein phosphatase CPPED1 like protein [Argiope bruennichi]|uniref:Serine/threonine-protein phosphatase CPPED1 n=1 Tax=Argiope bruennichi TaxID=94029 RepID=A0A8T0G0J2_ARGBR|nr:Serine/threonine-protein phosphatase CPPED1 like protein [Argiope bruennichi]